MCGEGGRGGSPRLEQEFTFFYNNNIVYLQYICIKWWYAIIFILQSSTNRPDIYKINVAELKKSKKPKNARMRMQRFKTTAR